MRLKSNDSVAGRGFSLIELMITIAISMIITTALGSIFISSAKLKAENDRLGEQIENGRFALDTLTQELRLAGYWGGMDMDLVRGYYRNYAARPSSLPDPCLTSTSELRDALPIHIQGDDSSSALSCLSDVKSGTDVVVIRRAGTCAVGETGCDSAVVSGAPYFQASFCSPNNGTELATVLGSASAWTDLLDDWFIVASGGSTFGLHKMLASDLANCNVSTNLAPVRPYKVKIFFVANNTAASDGIPALKLAELGASGFTIVTLASGIEQLQMEYGVDLSGDGVPEAYTANPGAYNSCGLTTCVDNWMNVVAVKIHLLARNTSLSPDYTDGKTYNLGNNADGAANTVGPFNDHYRRQPFNALVKTINIRG